MRGPEAPLLVPDGPLRLPPMIATLLLALAPAPLAAPAPSAPLVLAQDPVDRDEEYERRLEEAGDDVDELWRLYGWCTSFDMTREARSVARKIVRLDEFHRPAREALGHIEYDGRWFKNERERDKYIEEKEEEEARERGWVRWNDQWVDPADIPFLERGLVRAPDGTWVSEEDLEKMEAGWIRQDLVWIDPAEADNVTQGLWKCGDEWLPLSEADEYHASRRNWWRIPSDHLIVHSTCDRAVTMTGIRHMELAFRDLVRIYGQAPAVQLNVGLVRSVAQYNEFASEDPLGFSSLYGAYFPLSWIDWDEHVFKAGGIGVWNSETQEDDRWGPLHARFAVGLSFAQAIDSSPEALSDFGRSTSAELDVEDFLEEKRLPPWFTQGGAMFVSRFFLDLGSNANWAREWSTGSVASRGGLLPLAEVFRLPFGVGDGEGDAVEHRLLQSGLVMAFILDGENPAVREAHAKLKDALRRDRKIDDAMEELQEVLEDNEEAFRAFAGI